MASTFNAGTNTLVQTLLRTIAQMLNKDINLTNSKSFRAVIESPDGQVVNFKVIPLDQGYQTVQNGKSGDTLVVPASGAADLDGDTGTSTALVAGTLNVTVPGGVPVGSLCYATVAAVAGTPGVISCVRASATQITISSTNALETSTCRWAVIRP